MLKQQYLELPSTNQEWENLASQNFDAWQFPHAIAAADGKHVAIKRPPGAVSEYYNYRGFHSIVLMALVTSDYKFLFADAGCQGRISDGGVWANCKFAKKMVSSDTSFPPPKTLLKSGSPVWEHHTMPSSFLFERIS